MFQNDLGKKVICAMFSVFCIIGAFAQVIAPMVIR
jgi:hypothetical protein